jgi:hypothetical protein
VDLVCFHVQCFIRWTAENLQTAGGIEEKGIFISSDVNIAVMIAQVDTAYTPQVYNDATAISPISSAQTAYHLISHLGSMSCSTGFRNAFFAISSSEDDTRVTVTSPTSSSNSFTLNRLETYSEIAGNNNDELAGYQVTSSAPVTVVAGNLCTPSPSGAYITSLSPVNRYSTQYIVPAIQASQSSAYDVHIVASMNNTIVDIDGQQTLLQADEIFVQTVDDQSTTSQVICSLPCNVIQFTLGNSDTAKLAIDVIATNDFYTQATFTTSEDLSLHHITVIVDSPAPVSDILLDGVPFDPVWSINADYIYSTADVGKGYHVMNSTESSFAVYTYAHTPPSYSGGYGFAVLPSGKHCSLVVNTL